MKTRKVVTLLIVVLTATGAFLLQWSLTRESTSNWLPMCLPYPGPGMTIRDTFSIATGGRFQVQILSPSVAIDRSEGREGSPVKTTLRLEVSGGRSVRIAKTISSVRIAGWLSDIEIFAADGLIDLPTGGEYDVALNSVERHESFTQRGSMVRLARIQPVGPDLLYSIARWSAYFCFFCSCVAAMAMGWRR